MWNAVSKYSELFPDDTVFVALNWFFWCAAVAVLMVFALVYAVKARSHPAVVVKEWRHNVRVNFFAAPAIAVCMLGIGAPWEQTDLTFHRAMWLTAWAYQSVFSLFVYRRWIYELAAQESAAAQYLLSIVSWFLLCVLGGKASIDEYSGMPLRAMCFGIGAFWAVLAYPFILTGIHVGRTKSGAPALFLMLAPPSVAALGIADLGGGPGPACEAIFGVVVFLLIFLLVSKPSIWKQPEIIGVYWAYVFPLAAIASLAIRIARSRRNAGLGAMDLDGRRTGPMDGLACGLVILAALGLVMVFIRMSTHCFMVMRGRASWLDPLAADAPASPTIPVAVVTSDTPAR